MKRTFRLEAEVDSLTLGELRKFVDATRAVDDDYPLYEEAGVRGILSVEIDADTLNCLTCLDSPRAGHYCAQCGLQGDE